MVQPTRNPFLQEEDHPIQILKWVNAHSDLSKYPLVARAKMYRTTQLPGDLVFIPGGCPHAVQNLEDIHGLSMNYVDSSNYYLHLWTRVMNGRYHSLLRKIQRK